MLAWLIGTWVGILAGCVAGSYLLKPKAVTNYDALDISADMDDNKEPPLGKDGKPLPAMVEVLSMAPPWAKYPDYEKTLWLNHAVTTLWPFYNKAVAKLVLEQAKPQIDEAIKPYPFIEAVTLDELDLGTFPMSVMGVKAYDTYGDDKVIMEVPVSWGSNCKIRASARLAFAGYAVDIPVTVKDLQAKAVARVSIAPLVDTIPCTGAVDISLLEAPTLDVSLCLIGGFDLLALPLLSQAAQFALKMVLNPMLVYPAHMSFPIMDNSGLPLKPEGMLLVKVLRGEKLKGKEVVGKIDPFVQMFVEDSRKKKTSTQKNTTSPQWDEELAFIIQDSNNDSLNVVVKDDDMGFNDKTIGVASIPLEEAEFIQFPGRSVPLSVDLMKPEAAGVMKMIGGVGKGVQGVGKGVAKGGQKSAKTVMRTATKGKLGGKKNGEGEGEGGGPKMPKADRGTVHLELRFVPFKKAGDQITGTDDKGEPEMSRTLTKGAAKPKHKGVLTVTLVKGSALVLEETDELDTFVELELHDPEKADVELQRSSVIMNEDNPRWGEKFDFVMVSATSALDLTVYDKQGFFDNLLSVKALTGKRPDKVKLGTLRIDVSDVVRNKKLSDTWPLQETETGELQLKLEWMALEVDEV